VRRGPVKVGEVARVELTEMGGGGETTTATSILCEPDGAPMPSLDKRQGGVTP
jgi:hypothetical protein